ncbi:MAG TPA: hypothetical protein VJ324_12520 [Candidatus Acidoferrum sp.]|nr:hypothetical protein [Candidatus Acidoferrum sp.]
MSTASATAASQHEGTGARLRNLMIGAMFAVVLLIPKLLHIRRNAQSWMAFRVFLGFAGAALVILPLSLWNSWLAAIAGLGMFLAAILLPPAEPHNFADDKARELGALVIVNGGKYHPGNAAPAPVQLFVGAEQIWALDSHFQPLVVIPAAEITSADALQKKDRWILQVRWSDNAAEFFYQGVFAEHFARVAESTLGSVMHSPLPILPKSRAASA